MPLNHALESNNAEMTKRLKYTKDILTHMLNNNNNNGSNKLNNVVNTLGGTGSNAGLSTNANTNPSNAGGMTSSSSRMGTLTSAVSSKRSMVSGGIASGMNVGMGESGMPMSVTGRTGTAASV